MLKVNYKLGHLPFSKFKVMAANSTLDIRMASCCIPVCAACSYSKATRKPWRNKRPNRHIGSQGTTVPGACISVNQMESPISGLVAHMKKNPTTWIYKLATIFVDYYSRMGYLHLQENLKANNTLKAKEAFEKHCNLFRIKIKQYHRDNGRFAEKVFVENIHQKGQTITYCGVNAYFQNGIAEKCIRDLQDTARTMILHANAWWPKAMSNHLWPYTMQQANDIMNAASTRNDNKSAIGVFSGMETKARLGQFHLLGCPAYILQNSLQAGQQIPKWHRRAQLGLFLGHSPTQACLVALILNFNTGLVSTQFHVKFDDLFKTVKDPDNEHPFLWKIRTHFVTEPRVGSPKIIERAEKDREIKEQIPEAPDLMTRIRCHAH